MTAHRNPADAVHRFLQAVSARLRGRRSGSAAATLRLPTRQRAVPTATRLRTRRVPLAVYALVLVAVPVGAYAVSKATGVWSVTGRPGFAAGQGHDPAEAAAEKEAAREQTTGTTPSPGASGPGVGAGKGTGTGASASARADGTLPRTPEDVKGWHTVAQLVAAFPSVTPAEIFGKFGVPTSTPTSRQLKELAEDGNGFDIPALRTWLDSRV